MYICWNIAADNREKRKEWREAFDQEWDTTGQIIIMQTGLFYVHNNIFVHLDLLNYSMTFNASFNNLLQNIYVFTI